MELVWKHTILHSLDCNKDMGLFEIMKDRDGHSLDGGQAPEDGLTLLSLSRSFLVQQARHTAKRGLPSARLQSSEYRDLGTRQS